MIVSDFLIKERIIQGLVSVSANFLLNFLTISKAMIVITYSILACLWLPFNENRWIFQRPPTPFPPTVPLNFEESATYKYLHVYSESFPFTCLSLPRCLTRKVNSGRTQRACQPRALMSRWNFTERPTRFCFSILPHDPNDLVFILKSCVSRSSATISQATIRYFRSWQKRTAFLRNCVAAVNTLISHSLKLICFGFLR